MVHLAAVLLRVIASVALLLVALFFSTYPRCLITLSDRLTVPACSVGDSDWHFPNPVSYCKVILRILDSITSVLLSASYSNYFDSIEINIITDLNNVYQTLCQLLVNMISPLIHGTLPFDTSYVNFFDC